MKYTYQYADDYREELKQLRVQQFQLKRRVEQLKELLDHETEEIELDEYLEEKQLTEVDLKIVSSMISSTEYALFWIESGYERKAFDKRPVTNRSKKQRTQLWAEIEQARAIESADDKELPEETKRLIREIMSVLSDRQKDVYYSIHAKGNTFEETAEYLSMTVSSVQTHLERAKKKIDRQLKYGCVQTGLLNI